jgi:hypothetical protein
MSHKPRKSSRKPKARTLSVSESSDGEDQQNNKEAQRPDIKDMFSEILTELRNLKKQSDEL